MSIEEPREAEADGRWLLVSDLDETLTGDAAALRALLGEVAATETLQLCVNSSRPFVSVMRTLRDFDAGFVPTALITAMGTDVHVHGERLEMWADRFAGWDRRVVDQVMERLGHRAHPAELQTAFKASFAVPRSQQERAMAALREAGVRCCVVRSGESDFDVLPPGADKGEATAFVAARLGVGRDRLIVAGDSGNDLAMFDVGGCGIVVGNARPELRDALRDHGDVYLAEAHHAAGIAEGLRYWGVPLNRRTSKQARG